LARPEVWTTKGVAQWTFRRQHRRVKRSIQHQQVLDSAEVARLIKTLEYVRWIGRPGYPV